MANPSSTASKAGMQVLDEGVSQGDQDVVAFRILVQGGQVFRFTARSDAYEKQSWAKIEHWNPVQGGWNLVHSLPYGLMATPSKLKYDPNGTKWAHFEKDFQRLFAAASAVLAASGAGRSTAKATKTAKTTTRPAR